MPEVSNDIIQSSSSTSSMNILVSTSGSDQIIEGGIAKNMATYTGEIIKDENTGKNTAIFLS